MGIPVGSFLELIQRKVRSWFADLSGGGGSADSWMSGGGDHMVCHDCRSHFPLPGCPAGHRCRSCGRVFCRNCMQSTGAFGCRNWKLPEFCKFCFLAIGRYDAGLDCDEKIGQSMSPRRFIDERLPHLVELQQCSPRSLHCSTSRSEEDDEEDAGKHFLSPSSVFSQDISEIDATSFSTVHEFYSCKSVTSSPLDSPSRSDERAENSPIYQKSGLLDHESTGYSRTPRAEAEELLENSNDYAESNASIFHSCETQEARKPLDFENNSLIWLPPLPVNEGDDVESGFFAFDDEDDGVCDLNAVFSSSSLDSDAFPAKEKPNDARNELLRASVHEHFRALVSQLLNGEGVHTPNENGREGWLEIVSSLAWQAANFVKPDTSRGGSMDPGDYVKVKCILSGSPSDSTLIKGVVCTKNVKHKRMISQHRNPRLLLLGGALEFQRVPNELASINTLLEQEIDHLKVAVAKIEARRPNVLLVEKSVASYAQEYLLPKEISLVLNVKRPLLERISRCTGAQIASSIDNLASARLGQCEIFRVQRVSEECSLVNQPNKKSNKTLMFFEGCPRRLGCTVLLRGTCLEELKKVKHVLQYASFAAYHLSLETSFLADEGATLPKIPQNPPVATRERPDSTDASVSMVFNSAISNIHLENSDEPEGAGSCSKPATAYLFPSIGISSPNKGFLGINSELEECNSSYDYIHPSDFSALTQADSLIGGVCPVSTALDLAIYRVQNEGSQSQHLESSAPSDLAVDVKTHDVGLVEDSDKEGNSLGTHMQLGAVHKQNRTTMVDGNEVPSEYFSTAENNQSILVSLSRSCVLKGTVCERSQLFRIKFYGSFDKPLGRYLREELFDQTTCCRSCKEPAEAHVRCYTHQQGNLTISVKRLSSMKLSGEQDGRIWMWHRCLKCASKDGVPPASQRVVMSDAAWGLSFGKFLELSFSNHATANRVASCGHSLQRDCLRFYGFGSMVAYFYYSPVDILSVCLPPPALEFTCQIQQNWHIREVAEVSSKMGYLYAEVFDLLNIIERKVGTSAYEPLKTSLHNYIIELKDILKRQRDEYDLLLQPAISLDSIRPSEAVDILELNHLRRCLLIDSYTWDRRIHQLDSFLKSKVSTFKVDSSLRETLIHNKLKEWTSESSCQDVRLDYWPEGTTTKSLNCNSNELVIADLSIKPVGSYLGADSPDSVSDEIYTQGACIGGEAPANGSSLERLSSFASNLSDKIDLAWTGTGQLVKAPPSGGPEAASIKLLSQMDSQCYRKIMTPVRVYSFDSALRIRDTAHRELSPAFHLSSVNSCDAFGDIGNLVRDPIPNMRRAFSQNAPRTGQNLTSLFGHTPLFVSSASRMLSEGARLLLPQTGHDNIVIAVYDNEPTSIISYALCSKEHVEFIACKLDQHVGGNEAVVNLLDNYSGASPMSSQHTSSLFENGFDEALPSQESLPLDPKQSHFRVSFEDESSLRADKAKFSVTCYFAKQFDSLRKKCCHSEVDFIRSLCRCKRWSAQGGKSNVYFAKSLDERFIIKQVTKTELDSLEDFAPEYFKYWLESVNTGSPTCLAKILGIYQVTVKHLKGGREVRMDLMVMENIFFGRNISRVYDLKGSSRSRYNPDTTGSNKVMLDLNLLETLRTKPIFLGSKAKRNLERAIWNDTSFLASVDVMDYSLLVGVDEERKELVLGIIDFMRQYTWDKHLETWVKASGILGGPKNATPTVISPKQYKKRFRKAMSSYFLTVPDQWSS